MGKVADSSVSLPVKADGAHRVKLYRANLLNTAIEDLSRDQQRVLMLCLIQIGRKGWPPGSIFKFQRQDWADKFDLTLPEAGRDLKKAINGFRGKCIFVREEIEGEKMDWGIDWTTSRGGSDERGVYALKLNQDLEKYLNPLAHELAFNVADFEFTRRIKYRYTLRLYYSLCQFRTTGTFVASLRQLREHWSLPESYEKWTAMRTRVLEPSMDEIRRFDGFETLTMTPLKNNGVVDRVLFQFDPVI